MCLHLCTPVLSTPIIIFVYAIVLTKNYGKKRIWAAYQRSPLVFRRLPRHRMPPIGEYHAHQLTLLCTITPMAIVIPINSAILPPVARWQSCRTKTQKAQSARPHNTVAHFSLGVLALNLCGAIRILCEYRRRWCGEPVRVHRINISVQRLRSE